MFQHLIRVKQDYWSHCFDAMSYSFMALKASFYFFVHAVYPDIFEFDGSREIEILNNILISKKKKLGLL
jgi:hypothetical protein